MTSAVLENEKLNDEQLTEVSGGSWIESYSVDLANAFKNKIPGFENLDPADPKTIAYCLANWTSGDNVVGKLKNMFAGYGIEMTYKGKPSEGNIYKYNGEVISRERAWQIINGQ